MNDIQFIQQLKEFFFEYFLAEELGDNPSMMNLIDLLDEYKESVIRKHEQTENRFLFNENFELDNMKNNEDYY